MPRGIYQRTEYHRNALKVSRPGAGVYFRTKYHKKILGQNGLKTQFEKGHKPFRFITGNIRDNSKRWKQKNKEKVNIMTHNRRARLRNTEGYFTLVEWLNLKKEFNYICPMCGKSEPKIKLTPDHIIPISKKGKNWISNIQPLCRNCNCKKFTKIIFFSPVAENQSTSQR